jgi:hypothetical protein
MIAISGVKAISVEQGHDRPTPECDDNEGNLQTQFARLSLFANCIITAEGGPTRLQLV